MACWMRLAGAAALLGDRAITARMMDVMIAIATESDGLSATVLALFTAPEIIDHTAKVLAQVLANPEVRGVWVRGDPPAIPR